MLIVTLSTEYGTPKDTRTDDHSPFPFNKLQLLGHDVVECNDNVVVVSGAVIYCQEMDGSGVRYSFQAAGNYQ